MFSRKFVDSINPECLQQSETNVQQFFLSKYFTGAPLFPMSSEHIVLFISCCYQKQLSPQTMTTYLSALAHFNKMEGYPDPTQDFIVKRTLQGFQKLKARPDTRLPITQ